MSQLTSSPEKRTDPYIGGCLKKFPLKQVCLSRKRYRTVVVRAGVRAAEEQPHSAIISIPTSKSQRRLRCAMAVHSAFGVSDPS